MRTHHLIPNLAAAAMIPTCCAVFAAHGAIMASFGDASTFYDTLGMPDPAALPEAYEGVRWRRTLAYFVDLCVIGVLAVFCWIIFAVLWLLSFGLLGPVLWFLFGLIPLAYHTLLLSGPRSATIGMRLFVFEFASVPRGRPGLCDGVTQI